MANEKRLIDRNEIFPNGTFFANAEDPMKSLDELIKRIWSIPTVDAVEVVRCKDCRWFEPYKDYKYSKGQCLHAHGLCHNLSPVDYCSLGERKDNGKTD